MKAKKSMIISMTIENDDYMPFRVLIDNVFYSLKKEAVLNSAKHL